MDSADLASMSLWLILLAIMLVGVVLLGVIVMRLRLLVRALKEAIEIVMSAIQSIPNAQTFVTTHSPIVIQQSGIKSLLLFSRADREIVVQHGPDNQTLRDWDGFPDLGTVVASRVLG